MGWGSTRGCAAYWPLLLALVLSLSDHAIAADWRTSAVFSQRLSADDGGLSNRNESSAASRTDLVASIIAEAPRWRLSLAPGVSGIFSTNRDNSFRNINFRFNGGFVQEAPRTQLSVSAAFVPRLVSEAQFDDTGVVRDDVLQFDLTAGVGIRHEVDALNSISLNATARAREFSEDVDGLTRNRSVGLVGGWQRNLSGTTGLSLSARGRYFENDRDRSSQAYSLSAGLSRTVNERLNYSLSLGPSIALSDRDDGDSTSLGVDVGGRLGYALTRSTDFSAALSQGFDQNSEGVLENRTSISASIRYAVNSQQSFSLASSVGFSNPVFSETDNDRVTVSVAPSYRLSLTERWALSLGYRLRIRDDGGDTDNSSSVFVSISRNIDLVP